jgi:hypothetical protein
MRSTATSDRSIQPRSRVKPPDLTRLTTNTINCRKNFGQDNQWRA